MKVIFSHDWLNGMRGGEKCLEALCELYPDSPIYTLFYEKGKISGPITRHAIIASKIQRFPGVYSSYRHYLPFFPNAIEAFSPKEADLVISTHHCVAKGIRKPKNAIHICYCFTPARYVWGFFEEYFGEKNMFLKALISFFLKKIKKWDLASNANVDHFVAISRHIQTRIKNCYGRDSEVIYPPVDTDFYTPDPNVKREDFYLVVSALVPYKKIDLAVSAFNRLGKKLVVIGDGPQKSALQKMAQSNIRFLGWQSNEEILENYRHARALIFPGEEDFGIVPVEMQACGGAVIAFAKGGALETVADGKTGVFFNEATEDSLIDAVRRFEQMSLNAEEARAQSLGFGRERFKTQMKLLAERVIR